MLPPLATLRNVMLISLLVCINALAQEASEFQLDASSTERLSLPSLSQGPARAGTMVREWAEEYRDTDLFHTVYLPANWTPEGPRLPIVFELTGNYFPTSGSTGRPEDAGFGFGLGGGRMIWVSLPYVDQENLANAPTWWGDTDATVRYMKTNVPKIIERYHANSDAVFLCGFSRGAIGVNHLGLHDDEVSGLWTAMATHDHFDGVRAWQGTEWGFPLDTYRDAATQRLARVAGRPYLICQNRHLRETQAWIGSQVDDARNFRFLPVDTGEILGEFPNEIAKHPHTDRWLLLPSRYRQEAWTWVNHVLNR